MAQAIGELREIALEISEIKQGGDRGRWGGGQGRVLIRVA